MKSLLLFTSILSLACQCKSGGGQPPASTMDVVQGDLILRDSVMAREEEMAIEREDYYTFWGYRFHIRGDFNGDGRQETLTEKHISLRTGEEIPKFCGLEEQDADCWWTDRVNLFRKPRCLLQSSDPGVPDFTIQTYECCSKGLIFLQNAGDLNGDKKDEILFVEDYNGCNGANRSAMLATFNKGKWKVVKEIDVMLDQFPYMSPEIVKKPGDEHKVEVAAFEKLLRETEPLLKKKQGKLFYYNKDLDGMNWHLLDTNW